MVIDVWQLFTVLLVTAVLQEFAIKPCVGFLRRYFEHFRKHIKVR